MSVNPALRSRSTSCCGDNTGSLCLNAAMHAFGMRSRHARCRSEAALLASQRSPAGGVVKAVVRDDQGRSGLEPCVQLLQGLQALGRRQEMERQQAGRAVERACRRTVDIAFVQVHARRERAECGAGEAQHLGGWIDSVEAPRRLHLGEGLQFQSATGAEHRDAGVGRGLFGQQHAGHPVQALQAGHQPRGSFGVARYGGGIGERGHRRRLLSAC